MQRRIGNAAARHPRVEYDQATGNRCDERGPRKRNRCGDPRVRNRLALLRIRHDCNVRAGN